MREGLAANDVTRVSGILNGTCNYILTEMEETGAAFDAVLADAQALGYAETDPTADVGGFDAAHKLALLAAHRLRAARSISIPSRFPASNRLLPRTSPSPANWAIASRLLGVAERTPSGISQRVRPCLTPANSPLGKIEGVTNAVLIEGDAFGSTMLTGPGAGGGPTACAVIADIVDAARGNVPPTFGMATGDGLSTPNPAPMGGDHGDYYMRLSAVRISPGALAEIATALGEAGVSIHRMRQYDHQGDAAAGRDCHP